jgi:hypothetical protein
VHVTAQLSWNNLVPWKPTVGEGPDVCFKGCLLVWMQLHLSFYFLPTFWNHKLTSCSCSGLRDHATLYSIYILFEAGGQYFSLQIYQVSSLIYWLNSLYSLGSCWPWKNWKLKFSSRKRSQELVKIPPTNVKLKYR